MKNIIIAYYKWNEVFLRYISSKFLVLKTLHRSTWTSLYAYEIKIKHWAASFTIHCKGFPRM